MGTAFSRAGAFTLAGLALAQSGLQTDGKVTEFEMPTPNTGPTTISIAPDDTLWIAAQAGNRIVHMTQDGKVLKEFVLPNPNSSPRIITIGSDNNFWFSEHTGNRMGRITPG